LLLALTLSDAGPKGRGYLVCCCEEIVESGAIGRAGPSRFLLLLRA